MSFARACVSALLLALLVPPFAACGAPPPADGGRCSYDTYDGACQLVGVMESTPGSGIAPGDVWARYVTRGATPGGKVDTLDLRYSVEPRHARMAAQHLRDNPVLRCQVSYIRAGACRPVVTMLKIPDMPGGRYASGAVQLAAP